MRSRISISRRALLAGLGLPAGVTAARPPGAVESRKTGSPSVKVIDAHSHLYHRGRPTWREDNRKLIEAADKLGIEQLCCSLEFGL